MEYGCPICKEMFTDYACNHRKYCSERCRNIAFSINNKGKTRSEKTKKLMSLSKRGNKNPLYKISPEKHPMWKGGRIIDYWGYSFILSPNHPFRNNKGYVREHRLVMEKHIGRYLNPLEVVHHINEIRNDNRIENLMLLSGRKEHAIFHDKKGATLCQKNR
jgi:endogenous inhibitor of DNA gyrase (YacG/DUF329 family)